MAVIFDSADICYESDEFVWWTLSLGTFLCHRDAKYVASVGARYLTTNRSTVNLGTAQIQYEGLRNSCSNAYAHFFDLTHSVCSITVRLRYQTVSQS